MLQQIKHKSGRRGWRNGVNGTVYFGPNAKDKARKDLTRNTFCPTGEGGGVDPSCSPGQSHANKIAESMGIKSKVVVEIIKGQGTGGGTPWEYNPATKEHKIAPKIIVRTDGSLTTQQIEKVIEHELVHVKQSEDGRIVMRKNDLKNNAIFWEGKEVIQEKDLNRLISRVKNTKSSHKSRLAALNEYKSLPWESEAYERADPKIDGLTTNAAKKRIPNPLRSDPTRTASLRRRFSTEMRRRFKALKKEITRVIVDEDLFGLEGVSHSPLGNAAKGRFRFASTSEKIQGFLGWLKKQIIFRIMGNTVDQIENGWWRQYTEAGVRQGAGRAFDDFQKRSSGKNALPMTEFYEGSRNDFLRDSFTKPVQVERVKVLAARTYTDLKGVTEAMSTGISRTLTDGLVRGDGPREIAQALNEDVDSIGIPRAELIARTEIIRAHAEGQLDALEAMGVEEVGVMVEWSTAGDERVCEKCSDLEGVVLTIQEAHNKIPRHPNCRCSFIPANVGEDTGDQVRGKSLIDKAFESSIGDDEDETWQGAEYDISRTRPDSILD